MILVSFFSEDSVLSDEIKLCYTVRPNKKETRFISEISSLPRKILFQTICFIIKGIFSSFIWYQTHDDISMQEWKGTI